MKPLQSKTGCAVVLGASGALGSTIARSFSEAGYQVIGTGCRRAPSCKISLQFDITQPAELARFGLWLKGQTPQIDIVTHCVGSAQDNLIVRTTDAEWRSNLDVNLKSAFRIAQLILPCFIRQRRGHFVFIGSWAAYTGRVGQVSYTAAKSGLIGFVRSLAREYASRNIQANCIVPGIFQSSMTNSLSSGAVEALLSDTVSGQFSEVDEIARFIIHLSTMRGVTGQVFQIDNRIGSHQ